VAQKFATERSKLKTVVDVLRTPNARQKAELDWQEIEYDEELVEEMMAQIVLEIGDFNSLLEFPRAAVKNFESCLRFGKLCPFAEICFAPPRRREATKQLLLDNGTLQHKVWDYARRDE
jgi:hypothetical protein